MINKKNFIIGILLIVGFGVSQAQAAIIGTFSDRTTWDAASGTIVLTDTFDNDLHTGNFSGVNSFSLDSGIVSTGGGTSGGQCNGVTGGQFVGCVGLGGGEVITWTFVLPSLVTAFGADVDLAIPGFISNDLAITVNGEAIDVNAFFGASSAGFLGITSDTAFSSFTFSSSTGTAFGVDNLALASVPEPSTLLLMGIGIVGLGFAKRKSKI